MERRGGEGGQAPPGHVTPHSLSSPHKRFATQLYVEISRFVTFFELIESTDGSFCFDFAGPMAAYGGRHVENIIHCTMALFLMAAIGSPQPHNSLDLEAPKFSDFLVTPVSF